MESSRMTTSFLCSTSRFAFSSTISATCTCRSAGSSKVEEITSPCTDRCMSVTSSGRSSMRRTISTISGWLVVIALAMACRSKIGRASCRVKGDWSSDVCSSDLVLDQPLRLLQHHLRHLHVPVRGLVEGRGDHLAVHGPLHVRDLLRTLVDEEDDQHDLGMVGRDRVGDGLQEQDRKSVV